MKPEAQLQKACCDYLTICCPDVLYWHNVNSQIMSGFVRKFLGKQAPKIIGMIIKFLHSIGMRNGVPDLTLHWRKDYSRVPLITEFVVHTLYLELKAGKAPASEDQKALHERLRDIGLSVYIIRSLDDLRNTIRETSIPCRDPFLNLPPRKKPCQTKSQK